MNERLALSDLRTAGQSETVPSKSDQSLRCLRYVLCSVALGLGLVHLWFGRAVLHDIDGISYLDMGDAYMRGDWKTAINGLWSPLYALLIGGVLRIVKPSGSWEFPVVHAVGFAIYAGALFCFDFLWTEFARVLRQRSCSQSDSWATFPQWSWLLLGYCLFLWVSLQLIGVTEETPDMLVPAVVYVASALLLRISADRARTRTFVVLGLVLGVGYLAKTVMFPLSLVFLAVAAFITHKKRQSLAGPLISLLMFFLLATSLLAALSRAKGRFTIGDSGRINYIWHVDGVPRLYWQGNYPGSGAPVHPPRVILTNPTIYEFVAPFSATFPPWYDPSYWYQGMNPHFDIRKQVRAILEGVGIYHGLFLKPGAALIAISLTLLLLGGSLREFGERLDVLIPALAALSTYALVHVEPRYVGAYIVVSWGGVLCQLRLPKGELASRLLKVSALAVVIIYSAELCLGTLRSAADDSSLSAKMQEELQVAANMGDAGLRPGDRVATVGGISAMVWARLARLQIVATLPEGTDLWSQGPDIRSRVLQAFQTTGAKAVIAETGPGTASSNGWKRIGKTEHYLYHLPLSDPGR